jgi:hypothetical protein
LTHNVAAEQATNEPFQGLAPFKPNKPSVSRPAERGQTTHHPIYREKKETIKLENPSTTTPLIGTSTASKLSDVASVIVAFIASTLI